MHNNVLLLTRYADFLNEKLGESTLVSCVSTSLTDIHFKFSNGYYLFVRFHKAHTFFLQPETSHYPKKNVLPQFKALQDRPITGVHPYLNDRGFYIQFSKGFALHIQCFGRRSSILLVRKNEVLDSFKDLSPTTQFELPSSPFVECSSMEECRKENRFIDAETLNELDKFGFWSASNQSQRWTEYIHEHLSTPIVLKEINDNYVLSFVSESNAVETYNDIAQVFHDFARLYLARERFASLKKQLTTNLNREITSIKKRLKRANTHVNKLKSRVDFKQIGDILMANMYQIPEKATTVRLLNFYTNEEVDITLKSNLSPQKNAERYYQKSKNSHLEVKHATELMNSLQKSLETVLEKLEMVETSTSTKELQQFDNLSKKSQKAEIEDKQLPYRVFEKGGFEIWVGKNAKSNDVLLKLMHKTDTWLHARGVAGSHVVIRNREEKSIPTPILEYAAALAAKYSKNQHDTLAAVIYTSPKYVRKFKGALPGQVRVDREEVILIEPLK